MIFSAFMNKNFFLKIEEKHAFDIAKTVKILVDRKNKINLQTTKIFKNSRKTFKYEFSILRENS